MKNNAYSSSRRSFLGLFLKVPLVPAAVLATRGVSAAPVLKTRLVLLNDFSIAGFRYYDGKTELPKLSPGTLLELRPEPTNPYDKFAVEIYHGAVKLGYVPRFCNRHISRMLQENIQLACNVLRLNLDAPYWDPVSVQIHLVQPAESKSMRF